MAWPAEASQFSISNSSGSMTANPENTTHFGADSAFDYGWAISPGQGETSAVYQSLGSGRPTSSRDFRLERTLGQPFMMACSVSEPGSKRSCVTVKGVIARASPAKSRCMSRRQTEAHHSLRTSRSLFEIPQSVAAMAAPGGALAMRRLPRIRDSLRRSRHRYCGPFWLCM